MEELTSLNGAWGNILRHMCKDPKEELMAYQRH